MSGFLEHGRTASGSPMASRGRGRKQAKKGVQLTLMVVGEPARASSFGVFARHSMPSTIYSSKSMLTRPFATWTFLVTIKTGASGTGRTTFVNTLCESEVLPHTIDQTPEEAHIETGIQIKPIQVGQYQHHFLSFLLRSIVGIRIFFGHRARRGWSQDRYDLDWHQRIRGQHWQRILVSPLLLALYR
jgi:hypothetical protein